MRNPHESGRKELPKRKNRDNLSNTRNQYHNDDGPEEVSYQIEIEGAFGDSAYQTEQNIYDSIDYNLGHKKDISPELLKTLEFYEKHEELTPAEKINQLAKNHKAKNKKINQYENFNKNYDKNLSEKNKKKEDEELAELIDLYDELEHTITNIEPLMKRDSQHHLMTDVVGEFMTAKGKNGKRWSKKPKRISTTEWKEYGQAIKDPKKRKEYYEKLKIFNKKMRIYRKNLHNHNKYIKENDHYEPTPREGNLNEPKNKPELFIKKSMKNTKRRNANKHKKVIRKKINEKLHEVTKINTNIA